MRQWKDITSYSRDDKERIPNTFEVREGPVRISICNGHIYYPGQWIMHCPALGIDTFELNAKSFEEAKMKALEAAKFRAETLLKAVEIIKES